MTISSGSTLLAKVLALVCWAERVNNVFSECSDLTVSIKVTIKPECNKSYQIKLHLIITFFFFFFFFFFFPSVLK